MEGTAKRTTWTIRLFRSLFPAVWRQIDTTTSDIDAVRAAVSGLRLDLDAEVKTASAEADSAADLHRFARLAVALAAPALRQLEGLTDGAWAAGIPWPESVDPALIEAGLVEPPTTGRDYTITHTGLVALQAARRLGAWGL